MNPSPQAQAVLLLTAWLSRPGKDDPKPLTPAEWGRFARWLKENELAPEDLLAERDSAERLSGWADRSVTPERIAALLARAGALGLALEKWQRAGLWVMTRADTDYPARLKQRLGFDAPAALFGCGHRPLLDKGGLAVIGSREASTEDIEFAAGLVAEVAAQGYSVVSGGARGVDESAMLGALDKEGAVIGVLADGLLQAATSARFRPGLMSRNLILVSPFNPEAGFDVGNAMARNKYIYCLADAAVVVATGKDKGGTWAGAVEALRHGWAPVWVKAHPDAQSGNAALVTLGARWLPEVPYEVGDLLTPTAPPVAPGLFDAPLAAMPEDATLRESSPPLVIAPAAIPPSSALSPYDAFLDGLAVATRAEPLTAQALQARLAITADQVKDWLARALAERRVVKFSKPARYQIVSAEQRSLGI